MAIEDNAAPAGDSEQPVAAVSAEPTDHSPERQDNGPQSFDTLDDAVDFAMRENPAEGRKRDEQGRFVSANPTGEAEGYADGEGRPPQDDVDPNMQAADEQPVDPEGEPDGDEPEAGSASNNLKVRLRDNTEMTVGDLKKLADDGRTFRALEPQLQQAAQTLDAQRAQIQQERQELEEQFAYFQQVAAMGGIGPEPPDAALLEDDPIEYMQQKEAYEQHLQTQAWLEQQAVQRQQQNLQQQEQQRQQMMQYQSRLLAQKVPEFSDPKAREGFQQNWMKVAEKYGYSPQEAGAVSDHRLVLLIRDYINMQQRLEGAPRAIEQAKQQAKSVRAKPLAPSKRMSSSERQQTRNDGLLKRAQESGSLDDVLAAAMALEQQ